MNSPFKVDPKKLPSKGVEPGDPYYHTAEIYQVIRDDEIHLEVVDNKELIQDVINSNADKCGLKNILMMYAKTGDVGLFQKGPVLNNFDATSITGESTDELLAKLPSELVAGRTVEQFLKEVTPQDIINFYNKSEVIEDVKKE